MNITHATHEEVVGDKLEAIFNRQKELMEKYHHIEQRSGLLQTEDCPVDLNDKRGQARLKDFSWRVTEELGEALDALRIQDYEHYSEELIDGLHFLTELSILSGVEFKFLSDYTEEDSLEYLYTKNKRDISELNNLIATYVENIGMMCNCLKNKAWKQTNMLTDKNNFFNKLKSVWDIYVSILSTQLTCDDIVDIYLRKSQVNKFRQRSQY